VGDQRQRFLQLLDPPGHFGLVLGQHQFDPLVLADAMHGCGASTLPHPMHRQPSIVSTIHAASARCGPGALTRVK
jgi:hypothetical protein